MNYYDELLRRVLGVEEVEIKDIPEIIRNPGPIYHNINTADPARSLRLEVQMGRDRMTLLIVDSYGAPLWIRHFNFIHVNE